MLSGSTEFVQAEDKQREQLREEVALLLPDDISAEELRAHFDALPGRYFQVHAARDIVDDVGLAHQFMQQLIAGEDTQALTPVSNWRNDPDRGCNLVKVCTWDRAGLFSHVAGALSAAGFNILSAQIFTRADNLALDTFQVVAAQTGAPATREQRDKFEPLLAEVLLKGDVDVRALIAHQPAAAPLYRSNEGERIPTSITFDNEISEERTALEIETEDRVGLLYVISQTLTEFQVDISSAKICTEKGAAHGHILRERIARRKDHRPDPPVRHHPRIARSDPAIGRALNGRGVEL